MNKKLATRMLLMLGITGLLFGGLFFLKAFGNKKMNEFFDSMPMPPAVVESAVAKRLSWPHQIRASGTLVAVNGVAVSAEVSGRVSRLGFESGDRVKAGDLLVELDSSTELADLADLQAQQRLAEIDLDRLQKLFALDTISRSQLDQAAATADSARAKVKAQQARIALKSIRAPFGGELGIRQVNLGEYLDPGSTIVSLQAVDPIYVDFSVPEQHLAAIQRELAVQLRIDAYPAVEFSGTVQAVAPQVDVATRNFVVRAQLANADGRLRPGSFADVSLQLGGSREVIAVPRTAISYNPYGNTVFVIGRQGEAASVSSRFVKIGDSVGDWVEVVEGVVEGEELASNGLFRLRNGSAVVVDNSKTPQSEFSPAVENR